MTVRCCKLPNLTKPNLIKHNLHILNLTLREQIYTILVLKLNLGWVRLGQFSSHGQKWHFDQFLRMFIIHSTSFEISDSVLIDTYHADHLACSSFFWQKISSERERERENLIQSSILDVCDLSNAILCVFLCPHMLKESLENSWLKWRKEGEKAPKRQQHKNLVKEKLFSQVYLLYLTVA